MTSAVWEVIGGKKDGILVRRGKSIKSDEAEARLMCHSFIEEIELDGERLHYQLLTGTGPDTGWVSLKTKGQDLVVPAKMVVNQDPSEKALLSGQPAPQEWPSSGLDFLRTMVERRLAFPDSAPSLRVLGDVAVHIALDSYVTIDTFRVEVKGEAVDVQKAEAGVEPDFKVITRPQTFFKIFHGILDIETAMSQFKLYVSPKPPDEKLEAVIMFLTSLLVLEGPASLPADGVRRPVPLERGGQLPPPSQPDSKDKEVAPDWLVPDGEPAKKRRILMMAIPWSGHIVHLKRIAEWFSQHREYEVHFACMTDTAPTIADGVTVHTAKPEEMTRMFDEMQEIMRIGSMVQRGAKGDAQEAGDKASSEATMKDVDELMKADGPKLTIFLIRILMTVKPSIMVSDSGFSMGQLHKFGALFGMARTLYINSPGIMEERMVPTDLPPPPELWREIDQGKDDKPKEVWDGGLVQQSSTDIFIGAPPTAEEFMASGGKIDMDTINPAYRPLFEIKGMGLPMLMRLGDAMSKDNPALNPINVFPSSEWMIEQKPRGKEHQEFFSCPLLPLPLPIAGKLQVGRAALRNCLSADLLDWLFLEESKDPVVYVAFGTIVKGFKGVIERLAKALDGGSWRVLWALPKDLQAHLPADLPQDRWRVEAFVNQKDVLRCERVKCFLSHCGMNSTLEALASGVPMVCHPFFMDQFEWARTVRSHLRAGIEVHKFDSDADAIRGAIREVLEDPLYRVNASAVARRLRAQCESLKRLLGPSMAPRANLGPGATTIAAYMLCLLKGKDPSFLYDMVHTPASPA